MMNLLASPDPTSGFTTSGPVLIFAILVGGGLFAGIAKLLNAKTAAKQVELEHDPHSPRVAIGGAETAVKLMGETLEAMQSENKRLVQRVEHLEKENGQLRARQLWLEQRLGVSPDEGPDVMPPKVDA